MALVQLAPPVAPAIPVAPPLIQRALPTEEEQVDGMAAQPFFRNLGRRLLDEEAARLLALHGNNSIYVGWKTHTSSITNVVAAARLRFQRHVQTGYPSLSRIAVQKLANRCLLCHYGLSGDENYFH
jgi:hypothetical protein